MSGPETMRAVVVHEWGPAGAISPEVVPLPEPGAAEVRVKIEAAGVGYVDGLMVQGEYQIKPPLPWRAGMEFAGVVDAVGPDVSELAVGDRVTGAASGALADYLVADEKVCIRTPDSLHSHLAAGFWVNHCTALLGLENLGRVRSGETVLVLGAAGGVGSSAVSVAKALGAHVIAAASTDEKRSYCISAGADEVIDYSADGWRDDLKQRYPGGVDVAYDPVGGDWTELALRSMAPGGRLLIVGFASGTIPAPRLNLALLKRCSIVGVNWGAESGADPATDQAVKQRLVDLLAAGQLIPAPVATWPLDDIGSALDAMLTRQTTGKVVITP